MTPEYIFIIYSCKKNTKKAELLYHLTNNRLHKTKCYIVNGDPSKSEYEIVDDKNLLLPCGDTYECLSDKTLSMLNTVSMMHPNCKGIIKCDDDILPNVKSINDFISFLEANPEKAYIGNVNTCYEVLSTWHYNKCSTLEYNTPMKVPECINAPGPLYYINMTTVRILNEMYIDKNFYEDVMIGYNLNKQGIFPENYFVYSDHFHENHLTNYQNIHNKKNIYVTLQGSLHDQVRQVASGYAIAKRKEMYLIFVHDEILEEPLLGMLTQFQYIDKKYMQYDAACVNLDEINSTTNDKDVWINMYFHNNLEYKECQDEIVDLLHLLDT